MLLGAVAVGLGFGVPSVIYENERIPYPLQVVFHMGIGCAVLLIVTFFVGWIPAAVIGSLAAEFGFAFALWKEFEVHYRREAEKIDQKLKEMQN